MPRKKFINLSGEKIGVLVVQNFSREKISWRMSQDREGNRREKKSPEIAYMWLCQCDCGKITEKSHKYLLNKRRKASPASCGCKSYDPARLRLLDTKHVAFVTLYCRYRSKAVLRGIMFSLSKEEAKTMFESKCFYCDQPPQQKQQRTARVGNYIYNGIDRIDSSVGYTWENSVPCCKTCNMAKGAMEIFEFSAWIEKVYKHKEYWALQERQEG